MLRIQSQNQTPPPDSRHLGPVYRDRSGGTWCCSRAIAPELVRCAALPSGVRCTSVSNNWSLSFLGLISLLIKGTQLNGPFCELSGKSDYQSKRTAFHLREWRQNKIIPLLKQEESCPSNHLLGQTCIPLLGESTRSPIPLPHLPNALTVRDHHQGFPRSMRARQLRDRLDKSVGDIARIDLTQKF